MLQIVASLTIVIYDCNSFIIQATGFEYSQRRLRRMSENNKSVISRYLNDVEIVNNDHFKVSPVAKSRFDRRRRPGEIC